MRRQTGPRAARSTSARRLQWRAEQLPGQTLEPPRPLDARQPPSMEGRAIARPNTPLTPVMSGCSDPSMEGRAIARPNPPRPSLVQIPAYLLQWRAEQLPGQTPPLTLFPPSVRTSFNGGPSNCSAKPAAPRPQRSPQPSFNGGPSNCPAKLGDLVSVREAVAPLQWRAEQLPGQTRLTGVGHVPVAVPSMEGRAIARPNSATMLGTVTSPSILQWRAEQLPGQTWASWKILILALRLQWRAEQLPGQTWPT